MPPQKFIRVVGASEHNLKHINVDIPRNTMTVVTGLSGSGKSSLAFDTIYAEGQRRYVESLSSYARQFLDQMQKPKVEHIEGLSPAISIEQKSVSRNPRSTVGTVTEIYDYLRILYANVGHAHCPHCGLPLEGQTVQDIVDTVLAYPEGTRALLMAPVVRGRKGEYGQIFDQAMRDGFTRAKVDGKVVELEESLKLDKRYKHSISIIIDRIVVAPDLKSRLTDSVELALKKAEGLVAVEVVGLPAGAKGEGAPALGERVFSESMACPEHGPQIVELSPRMFSFNSPYGACPACNGLGTSNEVDPDRVIDPTKTIAEGAILPWSALLVDSGKQRKRESHSWGAQWTRTVCERLGIDVNKPFTKLRPRDRETLMYGEGVGKIPVHFRSQSGSSFKASIDFQGIVGGVERRLRETTSEAVREYLTQFYSDRPCPACRGMRLRPESLAVTLGEANIAEFCRQTVEEAMRWFDGLQLTAREAKIAEQPIKEIRDRLMFLNNVGLGYLTLDRAAATLAGGEGQRIRLATQVGSQLVGVLYILDEPSIGLHQRDNARLIATLHRLRDLGNTVIVVEHDESAIRAADWVIDLGPGAGRLGGEVVAVGPPAEIERHPSSITGAYLSKRERIPIPEGRRPVDLTRVLVVRGAEEHNLKKIDVRFPLGAMTCITGVSGSGKSTLVNDILLEALSRTLHGSNTSNPGRHAGIDGVDQIDKAIAIDQSPIGRTPRSNPATYVGLFSPIRDLFADLPESRVRGYKPGRFSFNVQGGRCETCRGDGLIKIEMHFLPDVYVECEVCKGRRYNRETLEVLYKGKSIADVLDMTVEEALEFFSAVPAIRSKLQTLYDVGLDYIHLGQAATTLSGGEAQRIKLSRELSRRDTGRTLYILDEPTTGLHFADVERLLGVLQKLVELGNTVVVIEHHLDVIKTADWVIDMGPEGGAAGGTIVAEGPPEWIAQQRASHTGRALASVLA
ncbi:MAG: excinuclease ABC subunit UvrA [Candidatus Sumerlaeota bacterium]|nr:excinuclease ABC subunit UvrA [Candidatus Sumerlaeota bacterium]